MFYSESCIILDIIREEDGRSTAKVNITHLNPDTDSTLQFLCVSQNQIEEARRAGLLNRGIFVPNRFGFEEPQLIDYGLPSIKRW